MAEGLSNDEIAHRLNIDVETFCWHLSAIYKKIHDRNIIETMSAGSEGSLT
jgi:DNA-binding CsgD family transcriptional regulator